MRTAWQEFVRDHGRAPAVPAAEGEEGETLGSVLGEEDPAISMVVDRKALRPMLEKLPQREHTILLHRFAGNKTRSGSLN